HGRACTFLGLQAQGDVGIDATTRQALRCCAACAAASGTWTESSNRVAMPRGPMTLKLRVTLVMGVLILAFVAADALLLFLQLRARAGAETASAVRSIAALLPGEIETGSDAERGIAEALARRLVSAGHIRHAKVSLYSADGKLVLASPDQGRPVPAFLRR